MGIAFGVASLCGVREAGRLCWWLKKGARVAIEGELRGHEYQREVLVGSAKTSIMQRVWEIRIDTLLTLDRAVRGEESTNTAPGELQ